MKFDVDYLENLSKLKIAENEKEKFVNEFETILDFVDEITKLELPEEDKSRAIPLNKLRDDEFVERDECDVLANAPEKRDGCYVTPLVVE